MFFIYSGAEGLYTTPVNMYSAGNFAVLGGSALVNTVSRMVEDMGASHMLLQE